MSQAGAARTTWFDTGSGPSEYGYVTQAEGYLEGKFKGDKLGLLNVIALISLAFGTKNAKEIFAGVVGFVPHWYLGGDGIDGMISALTGVQLAKGRWKTVAFPLILETLRTLKDFTKGNKIFLSKLDASRTAIFVGGYLAAMSRIV